MKNRLLLFFTVLIIFSSVVIGQGAYDVQVKKGLNLAYNFQFTEAEKAFSKAMEISPLRPEAFHYNAQIHLWAFLGSKDKSEYKIFMRWSDISLGKAEEMLKKTPSDARMNYILGNIYLLKAMADGADNSTMSAFSSSKTAFAHFEKALKLNSGFYDAYRGMGLLHYAMDFIPGVFKWAVNLSGMKADREIGFNYIHTAYKKGNEDKVESAFHLAKLFTDYAGDYDSAIVILKPLLAQYPGNPIFNYQAGVAHIKAGDFQEAEKCLNRVIVLNHPAVSQMNSLSLFLKGDIYFKKNDFINAAKYYSAFVEGAMDSDYTGIANYRLAVCCLMNGVKDMFKKAMTDACRGNDDIFEDEYAKRMSIELNGKELSQNELLYIKAANEFDSRKYQNVLKSLEPVVNSFNERALKAKSFLLMAECSIILKKYDEAYSFLHSADSIGETESKWLIPKSLYLKSLIEYKRGKLKQAKEFLEKAVDKNNYEFQNEISVLLNNLKRKIFKK